MPKTMTKLRDPDITNVDMVDKPANPGARILLFKRDTEDPSGGATSTSAASAMASSPPPKKSGLLAAIAKKLGFTDEELEEVAKEDGEATTFAEKLPEILTRKVMEDVYSFACALEGSIRSILTDTTVTDKASMLQGSLEQFHATVLTAIPLWVAGQTIIKSDDTEASAERTTQLKEVVESLQKSIAEGEQPEGVEKGMAGISKEALGKLSKQEQDYITGMEAELEKLKKQVATPPSAPVGKKDGGDEGASTEDVLKGLDPSVKKMFEDLQTKATAAESLAKKLADEVSTKEFVEKAAGLEHLGIKADEFGPVLKAISETNPDQYAKVEAALKAADEAVAKGNLFSEAGSNRRGDAAGSSWGKIIEGAKGAVAKSGETLSQEQAVAKFLETDEGQKLYTEYLKEQEGK